MKLVHRESGFYLVRRVPVRYQSVETRRQIWVALNTDSKKQAERRAAAAWEELCEAWEARLAGDTTEANARFEAARNIAKSHGYRYLPIEEVAQLPLDEVVDRVNRGHDKRGRPVMIEAQALLGTVPKPQITVTGALDIYWPVARDRIRGKSKDQIRRWKNPRIKAIRNFVKVVGDIPIDRITPDDMLEFRDWWNDRIDSENLTPHSANKDIAHVAAILRTVDRAKKLGLKMPLSGYSIADGEARTRPAFTEAWIRDKLLASGALAALNNEARCILLGMVNTGYRPSEAECMVASQIRLDCEIPHISIEPTGRTLKSSYARRVIPLLGVSLEAFKACPNGFPRYRDTAGCSNVINKFMAENGLKETDRHTLYSLRHSFQERMIRAKVDDRVRRDLFGHRLTEDRYGQVDLKFLQDCLVPVAL